jgi:hypothetical protein
MAAAGHFYSIGSAGATVAVPNIWSVSERNRRDHHVPSVCRKQSLT